MHVSIKKQSESFTGNNAQKSSLVKLVCLITNQPTNQQPTNQSFLIDQSLTLTYDKKMTRSQFSLLQESN